MKIDFRIPVFKVVDGVLAKTTDRIFVINFLIGQSWKKLRICIDGKLTKETVNILDCHNSKKHKFLSAIQFILESDKPPECPRTTRFLTDEKCKQIFATGIIKSIKSNILNTETEQSRDILQTYNLIFIEP